MSAKEQLLNEIEFAPDAIVEEILNFAGSPGFALIRQPYIKLSLGFSRRSGGIL